MLKQYDLFGTTDASNFSARRTDPVTSHEAATRVDEFRKAHHGLIMKALTEKGAMGKSRIARITGLDGVQIARRLPELKRLGKIEPTGLEVKSDSGRNEREWRVKVTAGIKNIS